MTYEKILIILNKFSFLVKYFCNKGFTQLKLAKNLS